MIKTIIFDMDGVLIDSEPIYKEINLKLFRDNGIDLQSEGYAKFVGMGGTEMWSQVKKTYNLPASVKELKDKEMDSMYEYLQNAERLQPIIGITNILEGLKKNDFKICIGSSSIRKVVSTVVKKLGIRHYFSYIVTGDEVVKGKPEPDLFLKVARDIRVLPEECLVIEDSHNGVLAAKRAGMKCIGYRNLNSGEQDLSSADLVIDNFKELTLSKIANL